MSDERDSEPTVDREVDVIVVGAGAAGFAAAITAAREGASVLLLEGSSAPGGTTAKSGGSVWIPNNSAMRTKGLADSRDDTLNYLARLAYPERYRPHSPTRGLAADDFALLEALYDFGSVATDSLLEVGAVYFQERRTPDGELMPPYPDYHSWLPENNHIIGRALSAGLPPGGEFPEVDVRPGFHIGVGGRSLVATLARAAAEAGVELLTDTRVSRLLVESDDDAPDATERITGVRAGDRTFTARRGVVFATGGFLQNPRMRQFLRGPVFGGGAPQTSQGDFVTIAGRVGAEFGNMTQAWWDQTVLEQALAVDGSTPETLAWPFGDSMIQVNQYGRRVVNEKAGYNERTQVHFYWNPSRLEYSNLLLFQIYDEAVAQNPLKWAYRGVTPMPGEERSYVISGETLDDLASNIDARLEQLAEATGSLRLHTGFAATLRETIARFNEFAESGVDADFERGSTPIALITNGPGRPGSANPTMAPIAAHGPYHCIILGAGALDTKGGPRVNDRAQVMAVSGQPIPGLFAAGNCISSPIGQTYPGAGASLGSALTFGYLAGLNAARERTGGPSRYSANQQ